MKKLFVFLISSVFVFSSCEKEKVVQENDLPGNALGFINTHYPNESIRQIVKERDDLKITYRVYLDNQTRLEFDGDGDIKIIDGVEPVPDSALPSLLVNYVNTNYPAEDIHSWDPGSTNQIVRLSNGTRLEFDNHGNFLRVVG